MAGYTMQSWFIAQEMLEWVNEDDDLAMAFWAILPISWGGLSVPGLAQQSQNAAGANVEEQLAVLRAWARTSTAARRAYGALFRSSFVDRTPDRVLMTPLGIERLAPKMSVNPMAKHIKKGLIIAKAEGKLASLPSIMLEMGNTELFRDFATAAVRTEPTLVIQEQVLLDVYDATPQSVFHAFVSRFAVERTFAHVCGRSILKAAAADNRQSARDAYNATRGLVGQSKNDAVPATVFPFRF